MSEKVEIKKILIKIGKKEIELSLAEAQELKQILDETFGTKVVEVHYDRWTPIYVSYPQITTPTWTYWQTTTSGGTYILNCTSQN